MGPVRPGDPRGAGARARMTAPLLVVNVRNLAGPHTGIEIYMEELLRALAGTGVL